jgi:hypothetical protein
MALLQAATLPHKAAILHCKGHQKYNTFISIKHNLANTIAKQMANKCPPQAILPIHYSYTQKEIELLKTQGVGQHKG